MLCKIPLYASCVNLAVCLSLQVFVAADMVGVGVGVVDGDQMPAIGVQMLAHLAARVLVAAAINEADVVVSETNQANFCRTFNIVVSGRDLY